MSDIDTRTETFIDKMLARYDCATSVVEGDVYMLDAIAAKIVQFVDEMQPLFDKLGVARDVALYRGSRRIILRSAWAREAIAEAVVHAFTDDGDLLTEAAAALLLAQVKAALTPPD